MIRLARVYGALFRAELMVAIEYRAQSVIWILTGIIPLVVLAVWLVIADQQPNGEISGFDQTTFVSYYLAVLVVRRLTGCWVIWEIDERIRLGKLNSWLLRPVDPGHHFFWTSAASKPVEFSMIFPVVAIAAVIFSAQYDWSLINIVLVMVTLFLGYLVEFLVAMTIGMTAFWFTQVVSFMTVYFWLRAFLSGWMIPLALFPEAVQSVLYFLPFRYVISFPIEILMGWLTPAEIGFGFAVIGGWMIALFSLYRLLWSTGLRKYSAVGA